MIIRRSNYLRVYASQLIRATFHQNLHAPQQSLIRRVAFHLSSAQGRIQPGIARLHRQPLRSVAQSRYQSQVAEPETALVLAPGIRSHHLLQVAVVPHVTHLASIKDKTNYQHTCKRLLLLFVPTVILF